MNDHSRKCLFCALWGAFVVCVLIVLCLALAGQAWADETYLQLNGASIHSGECQGGCNEKNWGLGIQRDWVTEEDPGYIQSLAAGTFINSMRDRSYYAGWSARYKMGPVGAGVFGGLIYYPAERSNYWPALLPMFSLNFKHVGVNAIWLPAVSKEAVPAWFFQFVVKL